MVSNGQMLGRLIFGKSRHLKFLIKNMGQIEYFSYPKNQILSSGESWESPNLYDLCDSLSLARSHQEVLGW